MVAAGRKPMLVPDHHVDDGINAVKLTFPRLIFNVTNCDRGDFGGVEALRQYRAEWDDKGRVFRSAPKHDWTSHAADALRYLAMAWRELIEPVAEPAKPLFKSLDEITMDEWINLEREPERLRI
jgi:phage terminase large subunit